MTIKQLLEKTDFKLITKENDNDISSVYTCDLLSIVMSKATAGCAWITVMGNVNSIAVAVLCDISCIILADGADLDTTALEKAKNQNVCVLKSNQPVFETALTVHNLLNA